MMATAQKALVRCSGALAVRTTVHSAPMRDVQGTASVSISHHLQHVAIGSWGIRDPLSTIAPRWLSAPPPGCQELRCRFPSRCVRERPVSLGLSTIYVLIPRPQLSTVRPTRILTSEGVASPFILPVWKPSSSVGTGRLNQFPTER